MIDRVDFYVLKSSAPKPRWSFACRLAEKAYLRDLRVVVLNDTAADNELMDELLWTFDERSFVPHAIDTGGAGGGAGGGDAIPVRLTLDLETIDRADLLVNLSDRLPDRMERFGRIAEIIDADDDRRRLGRERFKAYRNLKLPLETHQLDEAADTRCLSP